MDLTTASSSGEIERIIHILDDDSNLVNSSDEEGETSIFKAIRSNQLDVLPVLVAFGADVNFKNNSGQFPLTVAIDLKRLELIRLLCDFGASDQFTKWKMIQMNRRMLGEHDRTIMDIIGDQQRKLLGMKEGYIQHKMLYIRRSADSQKLSDLHVTLDQNDILEPYFLYCLKMSSEYSRIHDYLGNDSNRVVCSDVYKIRCWGYLKSTMLLSLKIPYVARPNESLSLLSIDGQVKIIHTKVYKNDEKKVTEVALQLQLRWKPIVQFAIIALENPPEVFKVDNKQMIIEPTMEPGASIVFPDETFKSKESLNINVASTIDWAKDDSEVANPILFTNVMMISVTSGCQPKQPVTITLPMNSLNGSYTESDVIVVFASNPLPEMTDWERIRSIQLSHNTITFEVEHFSCYVAGLRRYEDKVKEHATRAVKRERLVGVFVMLKQMDDMRASSLIFEYAWKRKLKERKKRWKNSGYNEQASKECILQNNRTFRISFAGDIVLQDYKNGETDILFDVSKKFSYKMFVVDSAGGNLPSGEINFAKRILRDQGMQQTKGNSLVQLIRKVSCFSDDNNYGPKYEHLFTLPIGTPQQNVLNPEASKISCTAAIMDKPVIRNCEVNWIRRVSWTTVPKENLLDANGQASHLQVQRQLDTEGILDHIPRREEPIRYRKVDVKIDPTDPLCTIPVLRISSLKRIGNLLTTNECYELGKKLGIQTGTLGRMQNEEQFQHKLFEEWRSMHKLPNNALAERLEDALLEIGRKEEAEVVMQAFSDKTEFNIF